MKKRTFALCALVVYVSTFMWGSRVSPRVASAANIAAAAITWAQYETDLTTAANAYIAAANAEVQPPPEGRVWHPQSLDKMSKVQAATAALQAAEAVVVTEPYADPPPPGAANYFGGKTWGVEKFKVHADPNKIDDSQWSGGDKDPAGRLWLLTDKIQNGGFLHRVRFAPTVGTDHVINLTVGGQPVNPNIFDPEDMSIGVATGTVVEVAVWEEQGERLCVGSFDYLNPPATIDLTVKATLTHSSEGMHYRSDKDEWHIFGTYAYSRVSRSGTVSSGSFDPTDMSSVWWYKVRGNAFDGNVCRNPIILKAHDNTLNQINHRVFEVDVDGTHADDNARVISSFGYGIRKVNDDGEYINEGVYIHPALDALKCEALILIDANTFWIAGEHKGQGDRNNLYKFTVQQP